MIISSQNPTRRAAAARPVALALAAIASLVAMLVTSQPAYSRSLSETALVIATQEHASDGLRTAAALRADGYHVTLDLRPSATSSTEWSLASLKRYASVWSMSSDRDYDAATVSQLESYVEQGGGLYLGGVQAEAPPAEGEEPHNQDQQILHAVLTSPTVRVTSDTYSGRNGFEPALDNISTTPNQLQEVNASAAGDVSGIPPRNALASVGRIFDAAAFDEQDMTSGKGRLVIYTDNWPNSGLDPEERDTFVENMQAFLEDNQNRTRPQSADYAALGDGWASGAGSFEDEEGTSGPKGCHRAGNGYVERIARTREFNYRFPACDGAENRAMGESTRTLPAQLEAIGAGTKAITLSVGWNDVGFPSIVTRCLHLTVKKPQTECAATLQPAIQAALSELLGGRQAGKHKVPGGLNVKNARYVPGLRELYESTAYQAPGAELIVIGYPQLFTIPTEGNSCQIGTGKTGAPVALSAANMKWLNDKTEALDGALAAAAQEAQQNTGASIKFLNPDDGFSGHRLCQESLRSQWLNPLTVEPSGRASAQSLLPKNAGQERIEFLIRENSPVLGGQEESPGM